MNINGKYLRVFDVEVKAKYVEITLSEGEKQKDGTWKNYFWNGVRFVGSSVDDAKTLEKGDVIEIISGKITPFKSEKGNYFLNTVVFEFDLMQRADNKPKDDFIQEDEDDDDVPY